VSVQLSAYRKAGTAMVLQIVLTNPMNQNHAERPIARLDFSGLLYSLITFYFPSEKFIMDDKHLIPVSIIHRYSILYIPQMPK